MSKCDDKTKKSGFQHIQTQEGRERECYRDAGERAIVSRAGTTRVSEARTEGLRATEYKR